MFKKLGKQLLSVMLAALMIFSVSIQAFAAEDSEPAIYDYDTFLAYFAFLEEIANVYQMEVDDSADPVELMIKYIRTGVDRYNSGSWGIMAGYEDVNFANFVMEVQMANNEGIPDEEKIYMTSLKNIHNFYLPNGDYVDLGHMFGTMDITNHNNGSVNHADVGGWAGDIVDLMSAADLGKVSGELEDMVAEISKNYLCKDLDEEVGANGQFTLTDMYGDLDAYYIMEKLTEAPYEFGVFTNVIAEYFNDGLNDSQRAEYLLKNRLGTTGTRESIRNAVYNAYISNNVVSTLEATREFLSEDMITLRKACCYAFADYLCELAGDYVEETENPYFDVFSSSLSTLAPGVTQEIKQATTADNKQISYFIATADITRDDVNLYANYTNNDPSTWAMSSVLEQANFAQEKYGNPESEHYVENYNVIASTNGAGYNMSTGEPGGLLVMGGVEYHPINDNGFFGILKDGTPVIGTTKEYNTVYKDKVQEAIACFGATLIKDGEIAVSATTNYYNDRASRTAVGITRTGKIVLMVLDGRQEPYSCGGSMIEIAQIMLDAGCVNAVNLDGGGSSTFVAKQEGEDELSVINKPSDGYVRSVSASLMMVSTAPSSTAFDHAVVDSDYDYLTVNSSVQLSASGVSATGNSAELPEGTSWAVSDESIGTITEDGVFTAKSKGDVSVNLMLGDTQLAYIDLHVVDPTSVGFSKTNVNSVYGSKLDLPIKVTYSGNPVQINAADLEFTFSDKTAGTMDGLSFVSSTTTAAEIVKITAALVADPSVSAYITVALYDQGEAAFDFDQATGGDREFAWDRKVSNTTTVDNVTYYVVNPNEDMETSYIFAIDMSKIEVPEYLADLTYMIPGADAAGTNAWVYMCQLAERISVLTEVKPVIRFDTDLDVDYSEIKVVNDYFTHTNTEFDEETNSLTLTLKWIDQTKSIDPTLANPMCILSGVKLTPKDDAQWSSTQKLNVVNAGEIGYSIYLRASALYTFANKAENQETYGIYPFVNPDLPSEKGGYLTSVYNHFEDTYTLVNALKNGWASEDGGFAFYEQGTKYYGIREVDGYYYDFGDNGINIGQNKYTGRLFDSETGKYHYAKNGVLQSGWQSVGEDWYYFGADMCSVSGHVKLNGVYFDFEADGRLVSGVWANAFNGWRYYYGPNYYAYSWHEIDGEMYYFRDGYRVTGIQNVSSQENKAIHKWYNFGEDGICRELENGCYTDIDGTMYYFVNGKSDAGLYKVDGEYYFFLYNGGIIKNQKYYVWKTGCDLPCGNYYFDEDGTLVNGFVEKEDGTYYYVNGQPDRSMVGLNKIGEDYIFIDYEGKCATGRVYVWATNCDLPCGYYEFGKDGKMLQGAVQTENGVYYYVNGQPNRSMVGLNKIGEDYYFMDYEGLCATGRIYVWKTNCDLPCAYYEFGEDGKMLQGAVQKEDGVHYYVNGQASRAMVGLNKIGEDYYFIDYDGRCFTGRPYVWKTNCDLPCAYYEFGEDGKMLQGFVEKEDGVYYYVNGQASRAMVGLNKIGEDYYFIDYEGRCYTGRPYVWKTNCELACGYYEFDENGKMLQGFVEKENGVYYYVNGQPSRSMVGLNKIGEDYYFIDYEGLCATGRVYVWATNCELARGYYEFGEDGKMLQGIVEKEDGVYYYVNGQASRAMVGLNKIGKDYYFIDYEGKCATGRVYVWATNCELACGYYEFGKDGKALNGFVTKEDGIYYFEKGKAGTVGINYIDGHYYFVNYGGKLTTSCSFYVWDANELLVEKTYKFNELGQIIG